MNPLKSPPGIAEEVRANSALVVAPHYDDEVLGCGGLVAGLTAEGAAVRALFLSDGAAGGDRDYADRRRTEARSAAKVLGLTGIDELALPDGRLEQHLDDIAGALRRALLSLRPELLLVTSPLEVSADHRAAFAAVHRLLGGARPGGELEPLVRDLDILLYEINHPQHPDVLVDVSDRVEKLERAMACYQSQQERHDYLGARLGLAKFRALTLPPEIGHVEAYRRLRLVDFTTRSSTNLIAELGGAAPRLEVREGPKISVIARTRDRPELLAQALASLAESTYRRADVVVVNDGGERPELPADFPLPARIVDLPENRGRGAAANAGLAAAEGDYIAFLDDDDLVFPEHLETLAGLVGAEGVRVAYTDAAVGIYELGESGWSCIERRLPYSRDFDPELLLVDNYIPIHTVAIDRRLLQEVGEMDPELTFFEDWDFLLRLAQHTRFHHLARVTCEYRQFRGGGHHILGDSPRQRADFLAMKARVIARHAPRLTPGAVARTIDRLRAEAVGGEEEIRRLRDEIVEAEEHAHRLRGKIAALETHQHALEVTEQRAREEVEALRRVEREQALALGEQHQQVRARDRVIAEQEEMQSSQEREIQERDRVIGELEEMQREQGEGIRKRDRVIQDQEEIIREQGEALEEHRRVVAEQDDVLAELRRALAEQEATTGRTYAEIERLNALIREMEATRAWRMHQWWQERKLGGPPEDAR